MQTVEIANYNGKLFLDHFGTVVPCDSERFFVGNTLSCTHKGKQVGTVRVEAVRRFKFKHISDALAYLECGNPAHYLAELLKRAALFENTTIQPDSLIDHVVFSYTERDLEVHYDLLKEWWQTKISQQKNLN